MIAEGESDRRIAGALVVGERTVANHVASILDERGFASRAPVAAW